jgi:hypothetical protein
VLRGIEDFRRRLAPQACRHSRRIRRVTAERRHDRGVPLLCVRPGGGGTSTATCPLPARIHNPRRAAAHRLRRTVHVRCSLIGAAGPPWTSSRRPQPTPRRLDAAACPELSQNRPSPGPECPRSEWTLWSFCRWSDTKLSRSRAEAAAGGAVEVILVASASVAVAGAGGEGVAEVILVASASVAVAGRGR